MTFGSTPPRIHIHCATLNYGNCERVCEFHSKFYDLPAPDQPIIEAIKVTAAVQFVKEAETA